MGLFKKKEQKKQNYEKYDPFKPKEDPYQKLLKTQEKTTKTRTKLSNWSFFLGLVVSILNLLVVLVRIEALNQTILVYTYPLALLLVVMTFYLGINIVGDKREFSIGTKLSFVVLILNLAPFMLLNTLKDYPNIVLTYLYISSSYLLLILVAVLKDRFEITKLPAISFLLLLLSFLFGTIALLLPLYGV